MQIAVASYKGGVGKTTTAVHIAAYLQTLAPTLLLDGDATRNATAWAESGPGFPFPVVDIFSAMKYARQVEHRVIDTGQRPSDKDLKAFVKDCDLLVIPAVPARLDSDGLGQLIAVLKEMGAENYRILITKAPPPPEQEAVHLRAALEEAQVPTFSVSIPRLKAFDKAAVAGTFVSQVSDSRALRAWEAYEQVGKEIVAYVSR